MFTLDAYAARSCPVKTAHAVRPGGVRRSAGQSGGMPGSAEFFDEAFAAVLGGAASVVDLRAIDHAPSEEQEAACLEAMRAGTEVIVGGLLPRDWENHRRGRADLLVRDPDGGYLPGLVKYQRALDARRDDREFVFSAARQLSAPLSITGWRYRWHWRWANALQVAHLWELLGPTGMRAERPRGVIVGTERLPGHELVGAWLDLDEPTLAPMPPMGDPNVLVSTLERYHQEFKERVRIASAAQAEDERETVLAPVVTTECGYCDWWDTCRGVLDDDDLSLRINKSPLDRHEITSLRAAGVHTVAQLAGADLETLLPSYLPLVAHRQGAEERLRLAQRRSRLLTDGVELDRLTSGPIAIPGAALEIDIDVETSRTDRVYLWGFWIDDEDGGHYQHFSSFCDLDEAQELALAVEAMTWLRTMVEQTDALVYHYSDYEVTRINRLAASGEPALVWAADYAAAGFVDLFDLVRRNFFGTNGLGLKAVASAGAGFHWRDDDPGGLNSMTWFDTAVHDERADKRELARRRVLCYNEDDVRATAQLRAWLRGLS